MTFFAIFWKSDPSAEMCTVAIHFFFYSSYVHRFLRDLEHRLEADILRFDVCDIVHDHCPALRRVYLPYVTNQAYQEQTYQRLL